MNKSELVKQSAAENTKVLAEVALAYNNAIIENVILLRQATESLNTANAELKETLKKT